ncbi:MAG: glutathione S-transferase N-terminal domain-containing protein [Novosphingobium sp.]|nr:glutathione S-transferase N-terminal domain-containing protein [Novosphingobium sp.]
MNYTLINARPSPYGRKVAIALIEKGISYDVQYDVPWSGGTCTPEYSPLEQLPILVSAADERIYDSTYILDWLEKRHPEPALLPGDVDGLLFEKRLQMLGERLMEIAQTLVFELQRENPSESWIARQTRKIRGGLDELERLIGDRHVGDHHPISLGDIAVGTTLLIWEYMVEAGFSPDHPAFHWRAGHANLSRYVMALDSRPSFRETRPQMMEVNLRENVK